MGTRLAKEAMRAEGGVLLLDRKKMVDLSKSKKPVRNTLSMITTAFQIIIIIILTLTQWPAHIGPPKI
jgi:hypothetical protein